MDWKIRKNGVTICSAEPQHKHQNLYHWGVWLFGDWNTALCAAGLDPERMRLRTSRNQEKIITGISALQKQRSKATITHHDERMQLCKWLNEEHDTEVSSRLIPLVDVLFTT